MSPARPGYVYVLAHPRWPAWFKVGHTHRPPHRRAQELSRTAVPEAFELHHARFVWDAPATERWVHQALVRTIGPQVRRKEFFQADAALICALIDTAPLLAPSSPPSLAPGDQEEPWQWEALPVSDHAWLEEQWGWAEAQRRSQDPKERRRGWAAMEALSSSGWGEASWRLAEDMMRHAPTQTTARRAVWVLDAAAAQGIDSARWRAAWLRSFFDEPSRQAWEALKPSLLARHAGQPWPQWPERDRQTWEADLRRPEPEPAPAPPSSPPLSPRC